MQTLSEQVKAYMKWRAERDRGGYTPAALAAEIAALQKDVDAPNRCKRQNIEHLLKKGFSTPRYIVELALVMGTTAETLKAGQFQPGVGTGEAMGMDALNGVEGQLITMYRELPPDEQERFRAELMASYKKQRQAPKGYTPKLAVAPFHPASQDNKREKTEAE